MSILTYLTSAIVRDSVRELDGKVLTRPSLLVTDGRSLIHGCDVDIGLPDNGGYLQSTAKAGTGESILRNVPIARSSRDLIYAEVGSAVRLRRSGSGVFEIVGYSQRMPGTITRIPVDLGDFSFGVIEDLTITSRPLTYGELETYGGYGTVPYGTVAIFKGNTLIELKS